MNRPTFIVEFDNAIECGQLRRIIERYRSDVTVCEIDSAIHDQERLVVSAALQQSKVASADDAERSMESYFAWVEAAETTDKRAAELRDMMNPAEVFGENLDD